MLENVQIAVSVMVIVFIALAVLFACVVFFSFIIRKFESAKALSNPDENTA
ncbi:MAG: hypothetical protein FWH32_01265 [Clostridiales bacterium]|nr:hypothetical protein [Clostridiales bacterium]